MVAIFVVLTFVVFLVIDFFVLKAKGKEHPAFITLPVFNKKFYIPEGIFLSQGHIWLKLMKDGLLRLGVDEFVLKAVKNIKLSNMLPEGTQVKKGDVIFRGITGSSTLAFRSPVNGVVVATNKNINDRNVNDPYEEDWGVAIQPSESASFLSAFKVKDQAINFLENEFKRLKDFISLHTADPELAGITMADGGNIVEGAVANVGEKILQEFEKNFLTVE